MKVIDLGHPGYFFRIVPMMRERMMGIGDADLGVRACAGFTRHLKRRHSRDVARQGQQLQIEHQSSMIRIGRGHAAGTIDIG